MNTLKQIFAGPASRRPHRVIGPVAALIAWSFFGTVHQVMHLGAFLTALFWLAGIDGTLCLFLYVRHLGRRISPNVPAAPKNDLEKAA